MTTKRSSLTTKANHDDQETTVEWSTTAVHLPKRTLQLLKLVAFNRAQATGGRMSVSKLVSELVESQRKALEREISK